MKRSLPIQLSISIILLLAFFLTSAIGILGFLWFRERSNALYNQAITSTRVMANSLNSVFLQAEMAAKLIADQLERAPASKQELPAMLQNAIEVIESQCPDLSSFSIAYCDGMLDPREKYNAYSGEKRNGKYHLVHWNSSVHDYFYRDWFLVPLSLRRPLWTVPYLAEAFPDTMLLSYCVPFYATRNGARIPAGVVLADVPIQTLQKYLHKMPLVDANHQNRSEPLLFNQFSQVVLSPCDRKDELNQTLFSFCEETAVPSPEDRKQAHRIFRDKEPEGCVMLQKAPILETPCKLFFTRCSNGWVVALAIPANWIEQMLRPLAFRFLLATAALLILVAAIIFSICRHLNRPLVALAHAAEAAGHGNFTFPLPAECKFQEETGKLADSFEKMQQALAVYIERLRQNIAARERTEGELQAAKAIQQDILPRKLPPFDHFTNLHGAAVLTPARWVGGDLYDVFTLNQEEIALIAGDVSGKGVAAALFMAVTQTLQRSIAQTESSPSQLTTRLNAMLETGNRANMFVTYWIGVLNIKTGILRYTNCGHNPPLLRHASGAVEMLPIRHGLPLAVMDDFQYREAELQLNAGDLLLLYTDGVTEAADPESELYGENRLKQALERCKENDPEKIISELRISIKEFVRGEEQSDDITMLAVRYDGAEK